MTRLHIHGREQHRYPLDSALAAAGATLITVVTLLILFFVLFVSRAG